MRLDDQRPSENIEDRRGRRARGGGGGLGRRLPVRGGGLGLGGLLIVMVAALVLGVNPMQLLGALGGGGELVAPQQTGELGAPDDSGGVFVSKVLGSTEDVWGREFQAGSVPGADGAYPAPRLVLFEDAVASACGQASSAVGPFYCPGDRQLYLDLSFFRELERRFGAPGDFAQAYVIAHEVGHHIQTVTGVSAQVRSAQARASKTDQNALQVRMELQADCLAGVWGHHAAARGQIEPGDPQEALAAAAAIGDDRLQKQAQGYVVPDSFTHGSSAQRQEWFERGYASGDARQCDTFAAGAL